jgi:acetyl esterase/lipase
VAGPNLDENDIQQQPADVRFVIDELVARGGPIAAQIDSSRVGVAGHSDGGETALAISAEPAPVGEPTIRCAIAMSVSPLVGVSHTLNPPLLVTQGDADTINLPSEASEAWQEASSPKYLVILHGAGHLPPLEAGSEWFPAIEAITVAFLNAYLGRTGAVSRIAAEGTHLPLTSVIVG